MTVHDDIHDNWYRFLILDHNYHYMDSRGYSDEPKDLDKIQIPTNHVRTKCTEWRFMESQFSRFRYPKDKYSIDRIDFYNTQGGKVTVTHFINPQANLATEC